MQKKYCVVKTKEGNYYVLPPHPEMYCSIPLESYIANYEDRPLSNLPFFSPKDKFNAMECRKVGLWDFCGLFQIKEIGVNPNTGLSNQKYFDTNKGEFVNTYSPFYKNSSLYKLLEESLEITLCNEKPEVSDGILPIIEIQFNIEITELSPSFVDRLVKGILVIKENESGSGILIDRSKENFNAPQIIKELLNVNCFEHNENENNFRYSNFHTKPIQEVYDPYGLKPQFYLKRDNTGLIQVYKIPRGLRNSDLLDNPKLPENMTLTSNENNEVNTVNTVNTLDVLEEVN